MNRTLRRHLDGVLDRRVAAAAEALAGARDRRDAARTVAASATGRARDVARARLAALRRPPDGPLTARGEAVARGWARIRDLDRDAATARAAAATAGHACTAARQGLLRALVRRRALDRILGGVAGGAP